MSAKKRPCGDFPEGTKELTLDALMTIDGDKVAVGTPVVKGVNVKAGVAEALVKGDKIRVIRYKAKKRVHKNGHRQKYSLIEITAISCSKNSSYNLSRSFSYLE